MTARARLGAAVVRHGVGDGPQLWTVAQRGVELGFVKLQLLDQHMSTQPSNDHVGVESTVWPSLDWDKALIVRNISVDIAGQIE